MKNDINTVFYENVKPFLEKTGKDVGLFFYIIICLFVLIFYACNKGEAYYIYTAVIIVVFIHIYGKSCHGKYIDGLVKDKIISELLPLFGNDIKWNKKRKFMLNALPETFDTLENNPFFTFYTNYSKDTLCGTYKKSDFQIAEVKSIQKEEKMKENVFQGIVINFRIKNPDEISFIIKPKGFAREVNIPRHYKKIDFDIPYFKYEIYADGYKPLLIETVQKITNLKHKYKKVAIAVKGEKISVILQRNLFPLSTFSTTNVCYFYLSDFKKIYNETQSIFFLTKEFCFQKKRKNKTTI